MQKVNGIGGVFFRSRDPDALSAWYETHLGVRRVGNTYEEGSWWQDRGPTVFAPFADDTDYFAHDRQMWMINFRVANLDAMIEQLEAAGIGVQRDPKDYPNGRFARIADPEGNSIELWEPAGTDLERP